MIYEKLIKEINPKPKFNLTWSETDDIYSDGDVEDLLISIIAENEPEHYTNVIAEKFSWATYYHLTNTRANIVNWYPFKKDASVLEIGCGFGAITGTLCNKCKKVTAVELSERRATGALLRCREYDNLEIIVGNLNDIQFTEKYDYITLIGVLEYQGKYTKTDNPYVDFLKTIKALLKPDGKLLIAIENQFGIKYWCGTREDHTGIPFDGLNNYVLSNSGIRTFSKGKLEKIIKESGFKNTFFYYPMPDYKLPKIIYSEKRLMSDEADKYEIKPYSSVGNNSVIAVETELYKELSDNGVFEFFANSFMVECSDTEDVGEIIYAKCNSTRFEEYQLGTRITRYDTVEKFVLNYKSARNMLMTNIDNTIELSERNVNVVRFASKDEDTITSKLIKGTPLHTIIDKAISANNKEKIIEVIDMLWEDIQKSSEEVKAEDNIMYTFGETFPQKDYGRINRKGYLDLITRNAFMDEGEVTWIDQEWSLENVPARYIMYRLLNYLYIDCSHIEKLISYKDFGDRYGILPDIKEYKALENLFLNSVVDGKLVAEYDAFKTATISDCVDNIKKII